MPPVVLRRTAASTVPLAVSLSKLLHLVPAALYSSYGKRDMQLVMGHGGGDDEELPEDSPEFMLKAIMAMIFVLLGGVFAGLTLALMGSDDLNLRVLATSSSDPSERKSAAKVLRLLSKGRHWVLVVLLLSNVIVNESLPVFLDPVLGGGLNAVIVSTILIVIFGEVIPQAVCVRYGLQIGGACAPMVHAMMILFAPIAWPIAKLLDWILGHDMGHTYKKAELKSFLQFHREGEEPLRDDEIHILNGVLSLNERKVNEIMTPIEDCLTLSVDKVLDHDVIDQILISGFSRIPVHEAGQPDNFIGMLLVKRLITYNPDDERPVSKFPLLPLPEAKPDLNCFQALDYFQTGRAHLLLISETPGRRGGALGVLSLEDLIEEIIGEEIIDETDRYQDNHSKRKAQRKATAAIMRGIIERQRVINAMSRRPSVSNERMRNTDAQGQETRNQSPAPKSREGMLVQISEAPIAAADPESSDLLNVTNSPKPRIVDITVVAPGDSDQQIHYAPAGHPKVDANATEIVEPEDIAQIVEDALASNGTSANGDNVPTAHLVDVTITDATDTGETNSTAESAADSTANNDVSKDDSGKVDSSKKDSSKTDGADKADSKTDDADKADSKTDDADKADSKADGSKNASASDAPSKPKKKKKGKKKGGQ